MPTTWLPYSERNLLRFHLRMGQSSKAPVRMTGTLADSTSFCCCSALALWSQGTLSTCILLVSDSQVTAVCQAFWQAHWDSESSKQFVACAKCQLLVPPCTTALGVRSRAQVCSAEMEERRAF